MPDIMGNFSIYEPSCSSVGWLVGSLFCWSDIEAANAMIPMKSDELSMSRFVSPADKSRSSMMSWSAGVSFDLYMSLSHSYYLKI